MDKDKPSDYYNLSYLEEISAGDTVFVKSILSQFIDEAPHVLEGIRAAALNKDWNDLYYRMHKFAPNLAFIGIIDIKEEVNQIETYSKNLTNLNLIPGLVDRLIHRCELAVKCLRKDFEL